MLDAADQVAPIVTEEAVVVLTDAVAVPGVAVVSGTFRHVEAVR